MKKIIIVLFIAFGLTQTTKAQGNLQFNKVINIDFRKVLINGNDGADTTLSVPANKIWKIESVSSSTFNDPTKISIKGVQSFLGTNIFLNNNLIFGTTGTNQPVSANFPFFLESSKSFTLGVKPTANLMNTSPFVFGCFLSIVEYNIVP